MRKSVLAFVTALVVVVSGAYLPQAQALTLNSVEGSWSNVLGTTVYEFRNNQSVSYGNQLEDQVRWGTPAYNTDKSGLGFTGRDTNPPVDIVFEQALELGRLRHFNFPIYDAASGVTSTIHTDFSGPAINTSFVFQLTVNETPNVNGSDWADRDFIYFPNSYAEQNFVIDGTTYYLQLLGFGPDAQHLVSQFESPENGTNSALLWGQITSVAPPAVPIPGALLLLGGGLARLLAYGRRRSSN